MYKTLCDLSVHFSRNRIWVTWVWRIRAHLAFKLLGAEKLGIGKMWKDPLCVVREKQLCASREGDMPESLGLPNDLKDILWREKIDFKGT